MPWRIIWVLLLALAPAWSASPEDTWTGVERIVAVGDVHGDYDALTALLRGAGIIDRDAKWIGGKTHLVQNGDILDRGPHSRRVMDLLMSLEAQARAAGGWVHCLIGNHETMNLYGDLRYVNPNEYAALRDANSERVRDLYYQQYLKELRNNPPASGMPTTDDAYRRKWDATHPLGYFEYRSLFAADGLYGKWLRGHETVIKINDMIFLHGGIGPKYAKTKIKDFNKEVTRELDDFSRLEGGMVMDPEGPLWYRGLAQLDENQIRPLVNSVLERLDARYIVIGHTPTKGYVNPRVDGHVICIDTGISQVYGSRPACLIVEGGKQFALHRGNRIEMPTNSGTDLMRYMNQITQIDRAVR